tara:strand:+ start:268 stop:792 length:525 start_codon:yes stop_codon:yes gene_type:complete
MGSPLIGQPSSLVLDHRGDRGFEPIGEGLRALLPDERAPFGLCMASDGQRRGALGRLFGQARSEDLPGLLAALTELGCGLIEDAASHDPQVVVVVEAPSGEQLVSDDRELKDVGGGGQRVEAKGLGRDVARRSPEIPLGQRVAGAAREAEIHQADRAIEAHHHVGGGDVAVHHR